LAAMSAPELGKQVSDLWIAHGRRRPVNIDDGDVARLQIGRELAQTDIDDPDLGAQQSARFGAVLWTAALGRRRHRHLRKIQKFMTCELMISVRGARDQRKFCAT
jgi:hypothetical protein